MAATDLPKWMWDLVIALQHHEDQHAKSDACLNGVLAAIPEDVRQQAEGISAYIRQARGHTVADQAAKTWTDMMGSFSKIFDTPQPADEAEPKPAAEKA